MERWPRAFDPSKAKADDEGLFYDGTVLFFARVYDDDEVEDGCIGFLNGFYNTDLAHGAQYCDALYTGYHSLTELLEGEFTTKCAWVAPTAYDAGTVAELAHLLFYDDVDLTDRLYKAREIIRELEG